MKITNTLLAVMLSSASMAPAWAVDSAHNGALSVPANRIVGLWTTQAATSPCGSNLPPSPQRNTILFQAGGTVVESPIFPPAGVPNVSTVSGINQRGQGMGTWSFEPLTNQFEIRLRFDWYVDGAYHGYQTVNRVIALSSDGQQAIGAVHSTRYAANGSVIVQVCGAAVSDRL